MKVTANSLKIIAEDLSKKITYNHMSNVTIINSRDIFITFSMHRKERLLISLNPGNPLVALIEIKNPTGTRIGNLNDTLRKEIKDGYVLGVSCLNNDRVLQIEYAKSNDFYEKEKKRLIIELIPHRANMVVVNEEDNITFATHYTDLVNDHPIIKGAKYHLMENNTQFEEEDFSLEKYKKEGEKYYQTAVRKRLQEQFKPILQHIKSRIKSLKHKIDVLNQEIETANNNIKCQEVGTMILTMSGDKESLDAYIKENNLAYDSSLSAGVNANKYFNKYKKAKRTIEIGKQELIKTENEIAYLESCQAQTKYMNEDDIAELGELLFPNKFKTNVKKKTQSKIGEISYNGNKIYFGKNAKQNDYLTFKKANKNDIFFHIKDLHGSHVVLSGNNIDNDSIETACEIALLLSGHEDGEIQSTKISYVKKGSFLGQALLTSYQTYTIKKIREKTRDLLNY